MRSLSGPLLEGAPGGAGWGSLAAGLLSGFFLAVPKPPSGREESRKSGPLFEGAPGKAGWGSLSAALLSALLALGFRFFAVPYPLPAATRFAWLFPALAAACFALRVPAEAPDAPASGASPIVRTLRRHAPDFAAALSLAAFAAVFAVRGPSLLSLAGLAFVLGVWFARLARPAAPLFLSAACFSLLLPDPAFLAYGLLAGAVRCPR